MLKNDLWALVVSVLLTYFAALAMDGKTKYRKMLLFVYVLLEVAMIFLCKGSIGISFYALACIGYVTDVYRGKYKWEKNPLILAALVCFFPTLVQGPICRYDELKKQLTDWKIKYEGFTYGLTRVAYGGFKKLVVADRLAIAFDSLCNMSSDGTMIFVNMFVYAFYLYADFSGGIDIAIGIGYMLGISLPENFKSPFFAVSISDYWRRWHMSLGAWLRDYVFYPVSFCQPVVSFSKKLRKKFGNKFGKKAPVIIASLIVWFVTGIWHGTSANFILWGMLNGVIIIISMELEPVYKSFNKRCAFTGGKIYGVFRIIRTFILMAILRMLDYNTVAEYFKSLCLLVTDFSFGRLIVTDYSQLGLDMANWIVAVLGCLIILMVDFIGRKKSYSEVIFKRGTLVSFGLIGLMIAVIIIFGMYGIGYEGKAFIYSRY